MSEPQRRWQGGRGPGLRARRIRVNRVSPGPTETETYRTGKSEQFLASLEAMSAFRPAR
jgi:NAD(P)-dependent dehydrogenase (short-subunit alcohol dehydrogenase family)